MEAKKIAKVEMLEETLARLIESGHLSKGDYMVTTIMTEVPPELRQLERQLEEEKANAKEAYKKVKAIEKKLNEYYMKP